MCPTVWYVVDVELGWDSVVGIYDNKEAALQCARDRGGEVEILSARLESKYVV